MRRRSRSPTLLVLLLAAPSVLRGSTSDGNAFELVDMGIVIRKPASWRFIPIPESEEERLRLIAKSSGAAAARAVGVNSVSVCQMNKYAFDDARKEPNPGVSVSVQNLAAERSITDAREFAKASVPSLKLLYRDIEFLEFLEPVAVGSLEGFRNRFRAKVDPEIYGGQLLIEQHFAMQGRIGICITYADSASGWKATAADFKAIARGIVAPTVPPPPPPSGPNP